MSTPIYRSPIRTAAGEAEVRITDTAPTVDTPDLSTRPADGGITLKMGDSGSSGSGFPTTLGSSFELRIPDPQYDFQDLFLSVFDDRRFEVALDLPGLGTWHGYVKSTLQTRRLTRKTSAGTTAIKCFDGLALLGEDDTAINARPLSVRQVLVEAFARANPDLPIVFYSDVSAKTIEGNDVGYDKLRPIAGNPRSYEPPQPNGPSGEQQEDGLEGETLRDQLDQLCERLTAVAYQDVRQQAWALVDVAAIGAPVTGQRYDGSSWSSYTFPQQTVDVTGSTPTLEDVQDGLKTKKSVRAVCTEVSNWVTDPGFESTLNGDDLFFWTTTDAKRSSEGKLTETSSTGYATQEVNFSNLDIYDDIDAVRLVTDVGAQAFPTGVAIFYGNGDTAVFQFSSNGDTDVYAPKDFDGDHDEITKIAVTVAPDGTGIGFVKLNLLQKLTDSPVGNDGDLNKYRVVDTFCYTADETGRATVEPDVGGFLTVLSGGEEVPAQEWQSARYSSSPYDRLSRWRAVNILALRPPPYERLSTRLLGEWAPLGTRLRVRKPGDTQDTFFVPLKGRDLEVSTADATTDLEDVELPRAVTDALPT